MDWSFLDKSIILSAIALGGWAVSMYRPHIIRGLTKPKGELSKKSAWVRAKTTTFLQRFFWWTFPVLALGLIWGPWNFGGMWWVIFMGFYSGAGLIYSQRLKRQWLLWQQLGYDGPPELAQQSDKLALTQGEDTTL